MLPGGYLLVGVPMTWEGQSSPPHANGAEGATHARWCGWAQQPVLQSSSELCKATKSLQH